MPLVAFFGTRKSDWGALGYPHYRPEETVRINALRSVDNSKTKLEPSNPKEVNANVCR